MIFSSLSYVQACDIATVRHIIISCVIMTFIIMTFEASVLSSSPAEIIKFIVDIVATANPQGRGKVVEMSLSLG